MNAPTRLSAIRPRKSKLNPPVAGLFTIDRFGLDSWFDRASRASLALLRAPAGFGKTTVMLSLLHRFEKAGWATAWLALDEGDNDPGRFLAGLLAAFQRIAPDLDPQAFERDSFEKESVLLNVLDWAATTPTPFVLFLDDFESVTSREVHEILREMALELPPGRLIAVASRDAPDLGLGKLRVSGRLFELGPDELRFEPGEALLFLRGRKGLDVDEEDARRLNRNTEGWAAALQLAALALAQREDTKEFIRSFSGSFADIADYLTEEVLSRQPPEVLDFLLRTSILDRLSAPLCDAVVGENVGCRMLPRLERANLFLVPLDAQRRWYRYHKVFAKFLRERLELDHPGEASKLHRRAAGWYDGRGLHDEAAKHALAAGDLALAAGFASKCAMALVRMGQAQTVRNWVSRFDRETLARHPQLSLALCWALGLGHRYFEANAMLAGIRAGLGEGGSVSPEVEDDLHALEVLSLADRGAECLKLAEKNFPLMHDRHSFSSGVLLNILGLRLAEAGRFAESRKVLHAADESHRKTGSILGRTFVECFAGYLKFTQGHLAQALERYRAIHRRTREELPFFSVPSAVASSFLGDALYEVDELEEVKRILEEARDLLSEVSPMDAVLLGCATLARIYVMAGEHGKAGEILALADSVADARMMARGRGTTGLERIRLALWRNDLAQASREAKRLDKRSFADLPRGWFSPANDPETLQVSELRLALRSGERVGPLIPRLRAEIASAEGFQRRRRALKLKVLLAEALALGGERPGALTTLREALEFGQREGFIRTFADEGGEVLSLLEEIAGSEGEEEGGEAFSGYVARILAAARGVGSSTPNAPAGEEPPLEALTGREVEIIRLASEGLSNKALAERLFVSVATVKYHLRNVNLKLDAANRTEAIAKARRIGLLSG